MATSTNFKALLARMLVEVEKTSGIKPDVVMVGTDARAKQALAFLKELGREDVTVIADDELGANSCWVTTLDALSKMPGGGRN